MNLVKFLEKKWELIVLLIVIVSFSYLLLIIGEIQKPCTLERAADLAKIKFGEFEGCNFVSKSEYLVNYFKINLVCDNGFDGIVIFDKYNCETISAFDNKLQKTIYP